MAVICSSGVVQYSHSGKQPYNRVLHCEVPKIRHSNIVAIQGSESIISSFTCELHFKLTPLLCLIIDLLVQSFPAF